MTTISEIRSYVYGMLDLDIEDLSTDLVDVWIGEGVNRLAQTVPQQAFYRFISVAQVAAGQPWIPLDNAAAVDKVTSDVWGTLLWISYAEWIERAGDAAGTPKFFSFAAGSATGGVLYLAPLPDVAAEVRITGWRDPMPIVPGMSAATEPDLPQVLHDALRSWTMYRAYLWDGSDDEAVSERREYDQAVATIMPNLSAMATAQPIIVGRNTKRRYSGTPRFPY